MKASKSVLLARKKKAWKEFHKTGEWPKSPVAKAIAHTKAVLKAHGK